MADRIRYATRDEQQREKMMALGKLSAGLAHELNNPASAAALAAENLREAVRCMRAADLAIDRLKLRAGPATVALRNRGQAPRCASLPHHRRSGTQRP